MKKGIILALVLAMLCLCGVTAGAANDGNPLTSLGINGSAVDFHTGTATGDGWSLTRNRGEGNYTLTLTGGSYKQITAYGDLRINVPAGTTLSVGRSDSSYAIGVQDGTLTFIGKGTLNLLGNVGLYARDGFIEFDGTTLVAAGTTHGAYLYNSTLTLNAGELTVTGSKYGIFSNKGLYVNGGILNATSTGTGTDDINSPPAGIGIKTANLYACAGIINARGYMGIHAFNGQVLLDGVSLTAKGTYDGLLGTDKTNIYIDGGECSFGGNSCGMDLTGGSRLIVTGGKTEATVTTSVYSTYSTGLLAVDSDISIEGGSLAASGYSAVFLDVDASSSTTSGSFSQTGGFVKLTGSANGLRARNAQLAVSGGALVAAGGEYAGIYTNYSPLSITDGTVSATGGTYGIYSGVGLIRVTGGSVFAEGTRYGIFSLTERVVLDGGRTCANGGNVGINVSGNTLTVGSSNLASVSCIATGGSWAVAGMNPNPEVQEDSGVILYGRVYAYKTALKYKVLSLSDGEIVYHSTDACSLHIDGSAVDSAATLTNGDTLFNPGGTTASYTWKITNEDGNYTLTLNNATLSSLEIRGSLTIKLTKGSASRITDGIDADYGLLTVTGEGTLSVCGGAGNAIDLEKSGLWLREANISLLPGAGNGNGINAFDADILLDAALDSTVRTSVIKLSSARLHVLDTTLTAMDCTSCIQADNSSVALLGTTMTTSSVGGYSINGASSPLRLINATLQLKGTSGILADKLTAADSTLDINATTGYGINVKTGGSSFDACDIKITALNQGILSESGILFRDTGINATSNSNNQAIYIYAPVGSAATISIEGHCILKSGGTLQRESRTDGVAVYYATGGIPVTTVIISKDHNYAVQERFESCSVSGTTVQMCTFTGCTCALCEQIAAVPHDFSDYTPDGNATCSSDGTKTATCAICGIERSTIADTGSRKPHTFRSYVSNNDATCLEDGTKTAVCIVCGESSAAIPDENSALGHAYVKTVLVASNCCEYGNYRFTCSRCGDSYEQRDTEYGNHVWTALTCDSMRICSKCGYEDGMILGHDFPPFVFADDATCLEDGTNVSTCTRCGLEKHIPAPGTATGHVPNDTWFRLKEPTAFEEGSALLYCSKCPVILERRSLPTIAVPASLSPFTVDAQTLTIRSIPTGVTVATLAKGFLNTENIVVDDAAGNRLAYEETCGTGCKMRIANSGVYTLFVRGDIDGDGITTASDARLALRASVGLEPSMDELAKEAANFDTADDTASGIVITAADARFLLRLSVDLETLPQD